MTMKSSFENVVFKYTPKNWSGEKFHQFGGFVAVVLNYNKAKYIERAVKGAFDQEYECYEILLMDDCSTDGSAEIMIELAKRYAAEGGKQKISVVVNKENQSIIGQWLQAVSLSDGNWFGMFCGDDVSLPNRISAMANIVNTYPTIWGGCANMLVDGRPRHVTSVLVWRGDDDPKRAGVVSGCTAFWNRKCFDQIMPRCNLDDLYLTWSVIIRTQGNSCPVFVYDYATPTVKYSVGTGITTDYLVSSRCSRTWICSTILKYYASIRYFTNFVLPAQRFIVEYDKCRGKDSIVRRIVYAMLLLAKMRAGGWSARILVCYECLTATCRGRLRGVSRTYYRELMICFVSRLLGIVSFSLFVVIQNYYRKLKYGIYNPSSR